MSELTDAEREALVEGVYEAYRLGAYGKQDYLPMWHELDRKPVGTPEAMVTIRAAERIKADAYQQGRADLAAKVEALVDEFASRGDRQLVETGLSVAGMIRHALADPEARS